MATVIDSLVIELGFDTRKVQEGLKETQVRTRSFSEDYQREHKVFQSLLGGLVNVVGRLAVAFLSVEAIIKGIEWTKGASAAATEYGNLAEAVGLTVTQMEKWDQAMQRVGGGPGEAGRAFQFQQTELMKRHGPSGQAPAFYLSGWWQRLGLGDPEKYYDPIKKSYDLDRLNRDIAEAMRKQRRSASERAQILRDFGFTSPAAQRLFAADLNEQLSRTSGSAMTPTQEETFRRLHAAWTDLANAAAAVARDLTVYLEKPIERLLEIIKGGMNWLRGVVPTLPQLDPGRPMSPGWLPGGSATPGAAPGSPSAAPAPAPFFNPSGRPMRWPWSASESSASPPLPPPVPTPAPVAPAPAPPASSAPSWFNPSGRPMRWPWSSSTPATPAPAMPAPAAPVPWGGAPYSGGPSTTSPPSVPLPWGGAPYRGGAVDPSLLNLPQQATAFSAATKGLDVTHSQQSSVTIGAISFNSRTSDSQMGFAPSDVAKQLSVAEYAIHSNQSIE
jgi:hypothetical protein